MSNEVTSEIPLKVSVTVSADEPAAVETAVEVSAETEPAPPEPPPPPIPNPEPARPSRLTLRNILTVLLVALMVVFLFFFWKGDAALLNLVPEAAEPFIDDGSLKQPQDTSQNTLILEEYFSQNRGAWSYSPPDQARLFGEALLLDDNIYAGNAWATPGLSFEDFVLSVDTRWLGGSLSGEYGIQIRKNRDTGEYLAFYLHNDGRFTVAQQTRRSFTVLANRYNGAIETEGGINKIQIEAVDQQVHFFVNGAYLGTFDSALPADGEIEFVATAGENGSNYKAGFDNLVITQNFISQSADG